MYRPLCIRHFSRSSMQLPKSSVQFGVHEMVPRSKPCVRHDAPPRSAPSQTSPPFCWPSPQLGSGWQPVSITVWQSTLHVSAPPPKPSDAHDAPAKSSPSHTSASDTSPSPHVKHASVMWLHSASHTSTPSAKP